MLTAVVAGLVAAIGSWALFQVQLRTRRRDELRAAAVDVIAAAQLHMQERDRLQALVRGREWSDEPDQVSEYFQEETKRLVHDLHLSRATAAQAVAVMRLLNRDLGTRAADFVYLAGGKRDPTVIDWEAFHAVQDAFIEVVRTVAPARRTFRLRSQWPWFGWSG